MRKTVAVTMALLGALSGAFAVAAPAAAANHDGRIEVDEVALFRDAFAEGPVYDEMFNIANYTGLKYPGTNTNLNDSVSSAYNWDSFYSVTLYKNANYSGASITLTPEGTAGFGIDDLSTVGMNNNISSHRWFAP
jgi:hypothetical protein